MNASSQLLALALLSFIAPSASASAQTESAKEATSVAIVRAEFGLLNASGSASPGFHPTDIVPHIPNQSYGWIMELRSPKRAVRVHEEFTLPKAPATWGDAEPGTKRVISANGKTATTTRTVEIKDGVIFQGWSVAPGDPKGKYVIRVRVESAPPKTFTFEVK